MVQAYMSATCGGLFSRPQGCAGPCPNSASSVTHSQTQAEAAECPPSSAAYPLEAAFRTPAAAGTPAVSYPTSWAEAEAERRIDPAWASRPGRRACPWVGPGTWECPLRSPVAAVGERVRRRIGLSKGVRRSPSGKQKETYLGSLQCSGRNRWHPLPFPSATLRSSYTARRRVSMPCLDAGSPHHSLCLIREQPLRLGSMTFAFAVLLECILHGNRLIHKVLVVHGFHRGIRVIKVVIRDKPVTLGFASLRVSCNLSRG